MNASPGAGANPLCLQRAVLGGLELKNRVFKAATHDASDFACMRETYTRLARNNVSLITVAYVAVSPNNKTFDHQHHIGEDNTHEWEKLCEAVHASGGKMSAQLHHPGLFCFSSKGTPMGPSFFWLPSKLAWPHAMNLQDLKDVKNEFVAAARLCVEVGFDCIEVHCGHGYLLSQFLTPLTNRRSDEYGGSVERRARFPAEIVQHIRVAVGESFPIVVKMNSEDGIPIRGLKLEESLQIAQIFADVGVDAIIPSFGYTSLNAFGMLRGNVPLAKLQEESVIPWAVRPLARFVVPKIEYDSLFLRDLTQRFVSALAHTSTKVIYVGGADSLQAIEDVLGDGCYGVQLGRPLIREPFFVRKIVKEVNNATDWKTVEVSSQCIRCNLCTLAALNPTRFKPGCPFLKPGEGADVEDIESMSHL